MAFACSVSSMMARTFLDMKFIFNILIVLYLFLIIFIVKFVMMSELLMVMCGYDVFVVIKMFCISGFM